MNLMSVFNVPMLDKLAKQEQNGLINIEHVFNISFPPYFFPFQQHSYASPKLQASQADSTK